MWPKDRYALIDGIFGEVLHRKNNVWKMRRITGKVFWVVGDGKGNYAHGDTAKDAAQDLIYKITNKTTDDYKGLTCESVLSYTEAIVCYRVITGACSFGVKNFVETVLGGKPKKRYSIQKIIELSTGHYGANTFADFFKVKANNA